MLPIKIKDPDLGFVEFKKQRDRYDLNYMMPGNAHEQRFNMGQDYPKLMKSRSPQFSLEKQLGRDDKAYQVNMTPSQAPPDIAKKLMFEETNILTFDKQSPRKGIVNFKAIN